MGWSTRWNFSPVTNQSESFLKYKVLRFDSTEPRSRTQSEALLKKELLDLPDSQILLHHVANIVVNIEFKLRYSHSSTVTLTSIYLIFSVIIMFFSYTETNDRKYKEPIKLIIVHFPPASDVIQHRMCLLVGSRSLSVS